MIAEQVRRAQATALLGALGIISCVRTADLGLPETGSRRSLILALEPNTGDELFVYAIDLDRPDFAEQFVLRDDFIVTVLGYTQNLSVQGIDTGRLVEARPENPRRPLPAHDIVWQRRGEADWEEIEVLPERLRSFFIDDIEPPNCVERGGCYVDRACTIPCPPIEEPIHAPAPPLPAELPDFDCPETWSARRLEKSGANICDPPPNISCSEPAVQFLGEAECRSIGRPCPAGEYSDNLPAGPIIFVNPAAPPGGDGTSAAPYQTIARALQSAAGGETIALAKGTYVETVSIDDSVTIIGACSTQTIITATSTSSAIVIRSSGVRLQDLSVGGGDAVIRAQLDSAVELSGIAVDGSMQVPPATIGINVEPGATARGELLVIRGAAGYGALIHGRAEFTRLIAERNYGAGVWVTPGAELEVRDSIFRDTLVLGNGFGLVSNAGELRAERVLIEGSSSAGVYLLGASSSTLTDAIIRDTRDLLGRPRGAGIIADRYMNASPRLHAARVFFDGNGYTSIRADRALLALEDIAVVGSEGYEEPDDLAIADGHGMLLYTSTVSISRLAIEHYIEEGLQIDGGRVTAEDLTILGPRSDSPPRPDGSGILIGNFARVRIDRARVHGARRAGMIIQGEGSSVDLSSLSISESVGRGTSELSTDGILIFGSQTGTISRAMIEGSDRQGIAISYRARITFEDVEIRDCVDKGFVGGDGGSAVVRRLSVANTGAAGVYLSGTQERMEATMEEISVSETRGRDMLSGASMVVRGGTIASVRRFEFLNAESDGLYFGPYVLAWGPRLTLTEGTIAGSPIGLHVIPAYELRDLLDRVVVSARTPYSP